LNRWQSVRQVVPLFPVSRCSTLEISDILSEPGDI